MTIRLSGPATIAAAIPHLIGYQPVESLVLTTIADGQLVCTARADLDDGPAAWLTMLDVIGRQQTIDSYVTVIYSDAVDLPDWVPFVAAVNDTECLDILRVWAGPDGTYRWRSTFCEDVNCCPVEGKPVPDLEPAAAALLDAHPGRHESITANRHLI